MEYTGKSLNSFPSRQTLATLRGLVTEASGTQLSDVSKALEDLTIAKRTLFGRVLIAEGGLEAKRQLSY